MNIFDDFRKSIKDNLPNDVVLNDDQLNKVAKNVWYIHNDQRRSLINRLGS